jgi:hypothetical protein
MGTHSTSVRTRPRSTAKMQRQRCIYFSFAARNAMQDSENELFYLPTVPERDPEVETEFQGGEVGSGATGDGGTADSAQKQKQKQKAASAAAASKAKRKSSGAKGKSKGKVCCCRLLHLLLVLLSLLLSATSCTTACVDYLFSCGSFSGVLCIAGNWWQTIENAVDKSKTRARPQGARSTGCSSGGSCTAWRLNG